MSNLLRISQKEFIDLMSSPMVLILLAGFFTMIALSFINLNYTIPVIIETNIGLRNEHVDSMGLFFSDWLFLNLIGFYGPIVGVMIGCSSIASERYRNALNTLLVKPLYRDTIINGKIIGSMAFLMVVVACVIAFYTSLVLVLYGNLIAPALDDYVSRLPVIFVFSLTTMAIFLTISILVSLLIKSQTFAMIISSIILYLFCNLEGYAMFIGNLFPGNEIVIQNFLTSLTPTGGMMEVRDRIFNSTYGLVESFEAVIPDIVKFLLFITVACIFSYIIFIRREDA